MFCTEGLFKHSQGPLAKPLCLFVSPLIYTKTAEIVEDGSRVWVIWTKRFFEDSERSSVDWPGLPVTSLNTVDLRQVVQGACHIRMLLHQEGLAHTQGPLQKQFSLTIVSLLVSQSRQVVHYGGHLGMYRSVDFLPNRQRP